MCGQAFSPRELYGLPGIKHLATIKHASKYKTTPLRSALQKTLGEDYLFGGRHEDSMNYGAKVAVTATDEAGKRAIILANYSRTDTSKGKRRKAAHDFPRPDNPELELRVWEAAAATSAAPSYFKPFVHKPTNRTYLDGALYNNNPVRVVQRERRLLWPDVATKHPDIFLSIGTSQNEEEIRKDLRMTPCRSKHNERYVVCAGSSFSAFHGCRSTTV
jgi:predicted acylesterase/phospholipase RssA